MTRRDARFARGWQAAFDELPEGLVTVDFAASGKGTLLTLRHEQFAEAGIRQQHRSGWLAACDRLERALAGAAARPGLRSAS